MATNQFLPFATGPGANVEDFGTWQANPTRLEGFYAGLAKSIEANTAIRQATFVGASLSEWVNEQLVSVPINDDGNQAEWIANYDAAFAHRVNQIVNVDLSGYLPLTGGTLYQAGQSDRLVMRSDAGQFARILYQVSGQPLWSAGEDAGGIFAIANETSGWIGLEIDPNSGLVTTPYGVSTGSGDIYSNNIHLNGAYLYFSGGTGSVNTTGGPFLFADGGNHVYKQGSGNGAWLFQNYQGTNILQLNSTGVCGITMAGTGVGTAINIPSVGGSAVIYVGNGGITTVGQSTFPSVGLTGGGVITALNIPNAGGGNVINVANGGISIASDSVFGGNGIRYSKFDGSNPFAFAWDSSNAAVLVYVGGSLEGAIRTSYSPHGNWANMSPGSFNWTAPAGVFWVFCKLWGGGGAGSGGTGLGDPNPLNHGGSGGGGGYCEGWFQVTPGSTYSGYIGAGGAPANNGGTAGDGGNTAFGPFAAYGGGGGSQGAGGGGSGAGGFVIAGGRGTDLDGYVLLALGGSAAGGGGAGGNVNMGGVVQPAQSPGGGGGAIDGYPTGCYGAGGGITLIW